MLLESHWNGTVEQIEYDQIISYSAIVNIK
jgi:hypothetical protein